MGLQTTLQATAAAVWCEQDQATLQPAPWLRSASGLPSSADDRGELSCRTSCSSRREAMGQAAEQQQGSDSKEGGP